MPWVASDLHKLHFLGLTGGPTRNTASFSSDDNLESRYFCKPYDGHLQQTNSLAPAVSEVYRLVAASPKFFPITSQIVSFLNINSRVSIRLINSTFIEYIEFILLAF